MHALKGLVCRAHATHMPRPARAHVACVPRLRLHQSFSCALLVHATQRKHTYWWYALAQVLTARLMKPRWPHLCLDNFFLFLQIVSDIDGDTPLALPAYAMRTPPLPPVVNVTDASRALHARLQPTPEGWKLPGDDVSSLVHSVITHADAVPALLREGGPRLLCAVWRHHCENSTSVSSAFVFAAVARCAALSFKNVSVQAEVMSTVGPRLLGALMRLFMGNSSVMSAFCAMFRNISISPAFQVRHL